jgi:Flp pilus assembly protein TadG
MKSRNRSGMGLIYATIIMSVMFLFCSLAVDYGRVQLAKTQLHAAADAAALAAAGELKNGITPALDAAQNIAAANKADGTPVALDVNSDIEFGRWDASAHTFSPLFGNARTNANSVRISAHRTAARGNAIDLPFSKTFGANACNVNASAIAVASPVRYAAVGLDFIKMSGNATDSYMSSGGVVPSYLGSIASNGDINLGGNSMVHGDAHPGIGKAVYGADHVSGSTSPLTQPLIYPVTDPGSIRTINDNSHVTPMSAISGGSLSLTSGQTATFPAGNYYFKNFSISAQSSVSVLGPVTIYCYGDVSMAGQAITAGNLPGNLRIVMVKTPTGGDPGSIKLSGGSALYADIYAPLSPITVTGGGDIYGSMVGKSITMSGNGTFHYDLSLANSGRVSLVN